MARYLFPFTGTGLSNRGDPFLELHREMNRLFDDASRGLAGGRDKSGMAFVAPTMDIYESENALEGNGRVARRFTERCRPPD